MDKKGEHKFVWVERGHGSGRSNYGRGSYGQNTLYRILKELIK
jgi:ribosomal protein L15